VTADSDTSAPATLSVVVPAPSSARSPWMPSVVASLAAGAAVGGSSAARGQLDPVAVVVSCAAVLAAQALGSLLARQTERAARDRWSAALDEVQGVCDARLEARRRHLRGLWPTSADLVERLRRGEDPPVRGRPSLVVLGAGRVDSGIVLVGDTAEAVTRHARTEALRRHVAEIADGPLCVDASGGVHVRGPDLLACSLAGGYRAQLRHRGAPEDTVTWQRPGLDEVGIDAGALRADGSVEGRAAPPGSGEVAGGGGPATAAACVVEISGDGSVAVVRRDGVPCSVPVAPAWTSLLDAPDGLDVDDVLRLPDGPRRRAVRPESPRARR